VDFNFVNLEGLTSVIDIVNPFYQDDNINHKISYEIKINNFYYLFFVFIIRIILLCKLNILYFFVTFNFIKLVYNQIHL